MCSSRFLLLWVFHTRSFVATEASVWSRYRCLLDITCVKRSVAVPMFLDSKASDFLDALYTTYEHEMAFRCDHQSSLQAKHLTCPSAVATADGICLMQSPIQQVTLAKPVWRIFSCQLMAPMLGRMHVPDGMLSQLSLASCML